MSQTIGRKESPEARNYILTGYQEVMLSIMPPDFGEGGGLTCGEACSSSSSYGGIHGADLLSLVLSFGDGDGKRAFCKHAPLQAENLACHRESMKK